MPNLQKIHQLQQATTRENGPIETFRWTHGGMNKAFYYTFFLGGHNFIILNMHWIVKWVLNNIFDEFIRGGIMLTA